LFLSASSGGKLNIYVNKPNGITNPLLIAKYFTNPLPVDDSVHCTIMRAANNALRNGRKALAYAKDSESEQYTDGTPPSGRTLYDYPCYI
jgi:hypothetical protein